MNITKKLVLGYGLIIILLVTFTGYFTFSQMDQMNNLNNQIVENMSANQDQISRLESSLFQLYSSMYTFYSEYSRESLDPYLDVLQRVMVNLVGIRTAQADPNLTSIIQPVEQNIQLQIQMLRDLQQSPASVKLKSSNILTDMSPELFMSNIKPASLISNIQKFFQGQIMREKLLSLKIRQNAYIYMGIIFLFAVFAGLGVGIYISRSIQVTIKRSSDQLNAVSDEILRMSEEESNKAVEQSEEFNTTSETLKGLSASASDIDERTGELTEAVNKTAERMSVLRETTEKINKIASLIEEISQQINILSLNASIEAFRAGDQGKGFSAVAIEIRKLAENSRSSTENIASLVSEIKDSTSATANSMEMAVVSVNQIADVVNTQHADTDNISDAVSRMSQGMQESVNNIQKTKSAAEELHQVALKLRSLI